MAMRVTAALLAAAAITVFGAGTAQAASILPDLPVGLGVDSILFEPFRSGS